MKMCEESCTKNQILGHQALQNLTDLKKINFTNNTFTMLAIWYNALQFIGNHIAKSTYRHPYRNLFSLSNNFSDGALVKTMLTKR